MRVGFLASSYSQLANRAAIEPLIGGIFIGSASLLTLGLRSCFNYQISALSFAGSNHLLDTLNAQHCESVGRISCMTTPDNKVVAKIFSRTFSIGHAYLTSMPREL